MSEQQQAKKQAKALRRIAKRDKERLTPHLIHDLFADEPHLEPHLPKSFIRKLDGRLLKPAVKTLELLDVRLKQSEQPQNSQIQQSVTHLLKSLRNRLKAPAMSSYQHFIEEAQSTKGPKGPIKKVLVIGAGVSGLTVASGLKKKGYEVVVVEGRNYIGGRLNTVDGLDLGGHWIHGGGPDPFTGEMDVDEINPIRKLCDRLGIETVLTCGDSTYVGEGQGRKIMFYDSDYTTLMKKKVDTFWDVYEEVIEYIEEIEQDLIKNNDDLNYIDEALETMFVRFEKERDPPLTDFEKRCINWHKESQLGGDYAEDAERQSFLYFDGVDTGHYQSFTGGDRILVGGYKSLIDKLSETVKDNVILNERVVEIHHGRTASDPTFVRAKTEKGNTYEADIAIVTLPLGILKRPKGDPNHVSFNPELPKEKLEAISRMNMACLNKIFLEFDKTYWPEKQYTFGFINRVKDEFPSMIINMKVSHNVPILCLLMGGESGRQMGLRSKEENLKWVMPFLRRLFDANMPDPKNYVATSWNTDPFAYGSYSCANSGIRLNDMTVLGDPVKGRLFFAGEATQPMFWGCVHGAYLSGLREIARITGDWSELPSRVLTVNRGQILFQVRSSRVYKALSKMSAEELNRAFKDMDTDGDGVLTLQELRRGLHKLGLSLSRGTATAVLEMIDTDKSGVISTSEFEKFVSDKENK